MLLSLKNLGLLAFLTLSKHRSSLPLLLILLVYHEFTSFLSHCTTTVRFISEWIVQ
jgi:hypothetical protein